MWPGPREARRKAEVQAAEARTSLQGAQAQLETLRKERDASRQQLEREQGARTQDRVRIAELEQRLQDTADLDERLEALTKESLEKGREHLMAKGKESLGEALKPFREDVEKFRSRFDQIIQETATERGALKEALGASRAEMTEFVRAVRGSPQQRGVWGERKLEQLLTAVGLKNGVHFETQESFRTDEGQLLRPDVVVFLPGERFLVIDAKTPLNPWMDYQEAVDDPQASQTHREALDAAFQTAVRQHRDRLAGQSYKDFRPGATFEICLMFVPIEAAWVHWLAGGGDHQLDGDTGVAVVSATTLIPVLRLVEQLWKQEERNVNALEIAKRGGLLLSKLENFLGNMEEVGKGLDKAQVKFDAARRQLNQGPGNLVNQAKQLQELGGFKGKKALPFSDGAESDDDGGEDEDAPEAPPA